MPNGYIPFLWAMAKKYPEKVRQRPTVSQLQAAFDHLWQGLTKEEKNFYRSLDRGGSANNPYLCTGGAGARPGLKPYQEAKASEAKREREREEMERHIREGVQNMLKEERMHDTKVRKGYVLYNREIMSDN